MSESAKNLLKLFYCYAHEDKLLSDTLKIHLRFLKQQNIIDIWYDREISHDGEWEHEIDRYLSTADIVLLLVSPHLLASGYCYSKEIALAVQRHEEGIARTVPIILRPVQWKNAPFSKLQALPTKAKPVTTWTNSDGAYENIAKGLRRIVKELQESRKTAEEWLEEGNALITLKHYREAILAFDQAIRLNPTDTLAHHNKGFALLHLKRYDEAIFSFDQTIQLDPNYADAYRNRGIALKKLKRYEKANPVAFGQIMLKRYDEVIRRNPTDAVAYRNKGITLGSLQRYDEAIPAYDETIRLDPNDADAHRNKGVALLNLKRYDEAIFSFDKAIRLNSNDADAHRNKGIALYELQRYEDAIRAYDEAIRLNPNYASAHDNKGNALYGLKRYEDAIRAYDEAIRLDPNDAVAYSNKGLALNELQMSERPTIPLEPIGPSLGQEITFTYSISVDVSPKEVSMGGEVEVVLSLGLTGNDSAYLLEVTQDEVSGLELNVLLTAPHFHINGENVSSLPLDLVAAQNVDIESIDSQTARFSLTALRSGPIKLQLDLYAGNVFKTSLEYTVQVARIDQIDSFSIQDLTRPRPVRSPDLILQVRNDVDTESGTGTFHYHLTSSHTITQIPEQGIEYRSTAFPIGWLERVYTLLHHTLESTAGAQATDRRTRLALLGQYLFRSLLPHELQRILRSLVDVVHTLLVLSDQDAAFPWTLLHDGNAFLGEHFCIGRWLRELHDTCPYEFPIGMVSIAYYESITKPEIWAEALAPPGIPEAVPLPGGLLNVGTTETIRGLHLLRAGKSSRTADLRDAPALHAETLSENSIEQQVQVAKFSLRCDHPLVTLSYLHAGMTEITTLEQSWSSTFIRAGCSAFIGPLWAVQPTVEATFVSTFYARLWVGDALGDAFRAARELTRMVAPNSIDYLAYVLFGDPMARPYRPVEGDGYATVEPVGREMEDPVLPGTSARFRVSLRRRPPIWHEGRVIEIAQSLNFEHLKIYIVTFGLQVTPETPISLMHASTGDYFGWFSLLVPIDSKRTASVVQVHFVDEPDPSEAGSDEFDESEPIHSLRFTLPIAGGDGNGR